MLPTVAIDGAWRFLVMLSFILPSPNTFTVNGLPNRSKALDKESWQQLLVKGVRGSVFNLGRADQQT